jgi:hypothetical protein
VRTTTRVRPALSVASIDLFVVSLLSLVLALSYRRSPEVVTLV